MLRPRCRVYSKNFISIGDDMSSDIMSSQILKDVTARTPQANKQQDVEIQKRQDIPAAGKDLPPEDSSKKEVTAEQAEKVVEQLNNHAQSVNRDLQFSVDDDSGKTVIKVVNSNTAELVRQIPSEEVLRLSQTIRDSVEQTTGVIVHTSA